ncbi:hypothetical protein [Ponticaulis sp.]|uniref:hypothetical protein n=1 Tax=Ponticaulis sp. TaxID=2020902 RepID=UPI000C6AA81C|nr:hypothetical protein [Ponticaulis sp.]MAF57946.1 hypothetical protein [Ponticaulis sp.]MBN05023.1 hypothetical protein [Ponticaulis sp.]|tara:strand:- start:478 stop:1020 length:543 start_codon:yes stop_codon:yes gene_type:complete
MKQISILACLILVAACGVDEARTPEPGVEEVVAPQTAQKDPVGEDVLLGDEGDYVDYVEPEPLSDVCSAVLDGCLPNSVGTLCSLRELDSGVEPAVTIEAFVRDAIPLLRDKNCPDFIVPYEVSRAETNGGLQFEQMVNASGYYASDVQAVFTGRLVKLDEHLMRFELTDVREPTFVPLD